MLCVWNVENFIYEHLIKFSFDAFSFEQIFPHTTPAKAKIIKLF